MAIVKLQKSMYSEPVVRKSLYWLSESSGWELSDDADSWIVILQSNSAEATQTLHRLLNDFLLRESIDRSTKGLRANVIAAALKKLGKSA